MANRAFAQVVDGITGNSGVPGAGITASVRYVVLDPDSNPVAGDARGVGVTFGYEASTDEVHDIIADAIRADMGDPTIKVRFVDYPGKF